MARPRPPDRTPESRRWPTRWAPGAARSALGARHRAGTSGRAGTAAGRPAGHNCFVALPTQPQKVWTGLTADPRHGPLPALLLLLTVVTGLVDAVSILSLGRVFVANMTGNVVFVGFALAGAPGFSLSASLYALGGFLVGAGAGGSVASRLGGDRAVLLRTAAGGELALLAVALLVAALAPRPFAGQDRDLLAAVTAVALGSQNAVVRRLAVPDLTTTVLTMTLTGIAADLRQRNRLVVARRLLAVAAMLAGAIVGAVLVLHVSPAAALGVATALLAVVTAGSTRAARRPAAWRS
jgi:uncharacterized membrane protein YoaK (UPF0700 family)